MGTDCGKPGFFEGVRVLDLSSHPRGRIAARMMAQFGADVARPDHPETPMDWPFLDAGKTPVSIDADVNEALSRVDIVIMTEGSERAFEVCATKLRSEHPSFIVGIASAFGRTGPRAGDATTDDLLQALAGSAMLARNEAHEPRLRALHFADSVTALHLVIACGAALIDRLTHGAGRLLDIAAYDCMFHLDAVHFPGVAFGGLDLPIYPYFDDRSGGDSTAIFQGVEKRLLVCAFGDYWPRFAGAIDRQDLIAHPDLLTDRGRSQHWDMIFPIVEQWLLAIGDDDTALAILLAAGVPVSFAERPDHVLDHPQLQTRGLVAPSRGSRRILHAPVLDDNVRIATRPINPLTTLSDWMGEHQECPSPSTSQSGRPLAGIRIIDPSMMVAGALATRIMADLGADIWKIEPLHGELGRYMDEVGGTPAGSFMTFQSAGKRSIAVDLAHPEGKALVHDLVKCSNGVLENFSSGVMERLGLDYATLQNLRPGLVMCAVSGFGQSGPFKEARTFDPVISAAVGIHASFPSAVGGAFEPWAICDTISAIQAAAAMVAALYRQARTGTGAYLDVAMIEAVVANEDGHFWNAATDNQNPDISGIVCGTPDDAIAVDLESAHDQNRLLELLSTEGFQASDVKSALDAWINKAGRDRVLDTLRRAGVLAEPVRRPIEILGDPQFAAHQPMATDCAWQHASPFHQCDFDLRPARAPGLSEHAVTLLNEAGLSAERIQNLVRSSIIIA